MLFPRVTVFFSLCVSLSTFNFVPSKAQKCESCQPRNFTQNSQPCLCPENQFCDPSNTKCTKCDECYDLYDELTKTKKTEVENILREFSKKYETDLNELQRLVKILTDSVPKRENEINRMIVASDKVGAEISEAKKLYDDLKKALEKLKTLEPSPDILKELKDIKTTMKDILEKLKNLPFDYDGQTTDFKNITETIMNLNTYFPSVEADSLGLSLALESDIELLESIISKFDSDSTKASNSPKNLWDSAKWIESDLLWLFNILNNYQNITLDVDQLKSNASRLKLAAEETPKKLDTLLKKHELFEEFLKILKDEHYKALMTKRFEEELKKFEEEQEAFKKKENQKRRNKEKMDKLLNEGTELIRKFETIGDVRPIEELLEEIEEITEEIEEIARNVSDKCKKTK